MLSGFAGAVEGETEEECHHEEEEDGPHSSVHTHFRGCRKGWKAGSHQRGHLHAHSVYEQKKKEWLARVLNIFSIDILVQKIRT